MYADEIFRQVHHVKGVNIGGVNINNFRPADDSVLIAECPLELQDLLTAINEISKAYGMKMNICSSHPVNTALRGRNADTDKSNIKQTGGR